MASRYSIRVSDAQHLRQRTGAASLVVLAYFPDGTTGFATFGDTDVDKERAAWAGPRAMAGAGWSGPSANEPLTEDYRDAAKLPEYAKPQYGEGTYVLLRTREEGEVTEVFPNLYGDGETVYTVEVTGFGGWAGITKQGVRERDIEGICNDPDDGPLPQPPE